MSGFACLSWVIEFYHLQFTLKFRNPLLHPPNFILHLLIVRLTVDGLLSSLIQQSLHSINSHMVTIHLLVSNILFCSESSYLTLVLGFESVPVSKLFHQTLLLLVQLDTQVPNSVQIRLSSRPLFCLLSHLGCKITVIFGFALRSSCDVAKVLMVNERHT